jgi:hypothetical protein
MKLCFRRFTGNVFTLPAGAVMGRPPPYPWHDRLLVAVYKRSTAAILVLGNASKANTKGEPIFVQLLVLLPSLNNTSNTHSECRSTGAHT